MKIGLTLLMIFAMGIAGSASAKVYTWTDANGVKHFSTENVPATYARQTAESENPCADYTNDYDMKFVTIKSGTFLMGSPPSELGRKGNDERQHKVTLTRPYQLQVTEVTQRQWQTVMGKNPSLIIGERLPVNRVLWSKVQKFIRKLNMLDPDGNYRLPTEAEWEYACRAGTRTAFSSGPIAYEACLPDPNLNLVGWFCGNSKKSLHPVAHKMPNAWGLYDMHGNVNEYCRDFYNPYPLSPITDPRGAKVGRHIITRGGSYLARAAACRSARRNTYRVDGASSDTGFRLARTIFCEDAQGSQTSGAKHPNVHDNKKER